jgi:hypothetical protein
MNGSSTELCHHGNYKCADYNKQPQTHSTDPLSLVGKFLTSVVVRAPNSPQRARGIRSHNGEGHNNPNRTTPLFVYTRTNVNTAMAVSRLCTCRCSNSTGILTAPAPLHFTFTSTCFCSLYGDHNILCNHDRQPRFDSNSDSRHQRSTLEKTPCTNVHQRRSVFNHKKKPLLPGCDRLSSCSCSLARGGAAAAKPAP